VPIILVAAFGANFMNISLSYSMLWYCFYASHVHIGKHKAVTWRLSVVLSSFLTLMQYICFF